MKVNHKQMYSMLKQQAKALQEQLTPSAEQVNEIPENFNQTGWNSTIEKVELMLEKMKQLREVKGNRLTPQFYRSIYNRSLIANNEIDKLHETLIASADESVNYEAECVKLTSTIYELNIKTAEAAAVKAAAAAAAEAAAAEVTKAAAEAAKAEAVKETAAAKAAK